MIETKRQHTAEGAILFDAAVLAQAGVDAFAPDWFDAAYWRARSTSSDARGGRGGVSFVDAPFGGVVLRHYRRGGFARILGDRYFWTGADRTRGFAEFNLLAKLRDLDLPVPAPVAAQYRRDGLGYRADLITRRIDNAETMAEQLIASRLDVATAARIGDCVAQFHANGVFHADLNAHNILIASDNVWLIDFDRGELRAPVDAWRASNLSRLHRSCLKVMRAESASNVDAFESTTWPALVQGYDTRFARAAPTSLRSART